MLSKERGHLEQGQPVLDFPHLREEYQMYLPLISLPPSQKLLVIWFTVI
jgi:hypothetical protein